MSTAQQKRRHEAWRKKYGKPGAFRYPSASIGAMGDHQQLQGKLEESKGCMHCFPEPSINGACRSSWNQDGEEEWLRQQDSIGVDTPEFGQAAGERAQAEGREGYQEGDGSMTRYEGRRRKPGSD
eukprot:756071-Hanusia_phi.AAC.5